MAGRRVAGPWISSVVAILLAACGISKPARVVGDAGLDTPPDNAAPVSPDTAIPFERPALEAALAPEIPTSYPKTGLPLPDGVPPPRRLLPAPAELTGGGTVNSCSNQQPASEDGHRWCAFSKPTADRNATELWVIDITAAAAGEIPVCDGSSPSCLRLTSNLWTVFPLVGPGHPYAHAFDGDTLIFYADALSGKDKPHRGPIYAWRPGWPAARTLTTDKGFACRGHDGVAVVICIDELDGDPVTAKTFTLRAGRLAPPVPNADNSLLPAVGTIAQIGADGFPDWQATFSRAGDRLAVSSPDLVTGTQVLSVIDTDAIGSAAPTPIITDAHSWAIAHDGRRVYFYRPPPGVAWSFDELMDLYAADFPSGANVAQVGTSVYDYKLLGDAPTDEGIVYLKETDPAHYHFSMVYLPNAGVPDQTATWFSYVGMLEEFRISRNRRITTWSNSEFLANAVRTETLETCVLNAGYGGAFVLEMLDSAGLAFWTEDNADDLAGRDAFVAPPDSCQPKQRFARGMSWYTPVGDRGLVFGDELDGYDRFVTMKYAATSNVGGTWHLGEPVRIDEGADPEFIVVGMESPLLLYVKQHSGADNGTYLFGPVPF